MQLLIRSALWLLVLLFLGSQLSAQPPGTTLPNDRPICLDSTQADVQASILYYQAIYEADSTNLDACKNIAMSHYKLKDFATAIAYYDRIIEQDPCYPGARSNRGYCRFFLKNQRGACADWEAALHCDFPEDLQAIILNGYERYCQ